MTPSRTPALRRLAVTVASAFWGLGLMGCNGASKPELGEASKEPSIAVVTVAGATYQASVTCYDAGAGSVAALGEGRDPVSGKDVQLYVQAFFQEPYLVLAVGDRLIEPTPTRPFDLSLVDGVIRGTDLQMVTDLDLATQQSTPVGVGTVTVTCRSFVAGLPSSFGQAGPRRALGTTTVATR
jgi:hypothetical protein